MSPTTHSSQIPRLRFSGFFGEWKEIKWNNLFENISDKKHNSDLPILAITQEYWAIPREMIDYKISVTDQSIDWYKIVQQGDFIISLRSFQWGIEYSTYKWICSPAYIILRKKEENIYDLFFKHYFKTSKYITKLNKKLEWIRDGKMISYKYFSDISLPFPSLPEQTKIASFLSAVDNKIQSLTDLRTAWAEYKTGLMQQIFSQEIRFPGFTDEWEEKKLGEIGDFQTSSIDKLSREDEKEVFLVNYMNVYRHESIDNNSIKEYQKVTAKDSQIESCNLKKWDILFTPSSETPDDIWHSVVIFEDLSNAVFSYHLMRFRPKSQINILYSHYFCNIPEVLKQMSQLATGSTRFTLSVKNFANIEIKLPSLQEQEKIANFLSSIDDKIAELESQIQTAKQWKTGLLQGLFI